MEGDAMTSSEEGKFGKDALLVAAAILLASLIIAGAIVAAIGKPVSGPTAANKDAAQAPAAAPTDSNATTSLDDDPVLGDKTKAKVAIVEFSDYECPFCQRFHKETFDKLVKDYVDTGKAVIAFRDFPLSFHEPNASMEAATATCVRKEKGDKAYFAFSQGLFENTISNGKGLPAGKLDELIRKAGANPGTVTACAASDEAKQEIAKDIEDGGKAGVSGTPSFIVGTLNADGTVTGERIVGAVPLDGFKTAIEKYLK
ncbi:MAG: hypothetical protein A3E38_01595 [Candidatus Moranbacteria bacterium RIFCSPHIGHO2_12_FULL_54_9]|nr:MAG: hypothetical protein A2878_02190 [Candidatus Moranbacteria bacterium RIFCSPHIGHO2_01_FULL_54_31]OGI25917.1 MAG: hypothetical protein A3E38_01595 [Candidatus Moranbacteria bacterium RIFCSPHIGHO2_12_FULL_54_9]